MRTEHMRETSLACLLDLGLKSHSRATRSHSVPGDDSSMSFTKASSAALLFACLLYCLFFPLCFLLPRIGIKGFQAFHLLFSPFADTFSDFRSTPRAEAARGVEETRKQYS
uniref:Transmembrane protein n=1 Tax=Piliocolobus tephrosceles TaxID=591936 RepID=A0A8C9GUG1_9PRIM